MDDIEAVDELTKQGVTFERYEGFEADEKGIARPTDPQQGPRSRGSETPPGTSWPCSRDDGWNQSDQRRRDASWT